MADDLAVTDIGLAGYLVTRGFPLLRLDGRPGRRVFRFPSDAGDECKGYFAGAVVPAREYAENLRNLKAQIRSAP
jgi:hypothetical protein